jgi:hypothetical protein
MVSSPLEEFATPLGAYPTNDPEGTQRPRRPLRNTLFLCVLCDPAFNRGRSLQRSRALPKVSAAIALIASRTGYGGVVQGVRRRQVFNPGEEDRRGDGSLWRDRLPDRPERHSGVETPQSLSSTPNRSAMR